jgi:phenylacetate-CoA ligase
MVTAFLAGRVVYRLHERMLGRPTFRYLAELERTQWLSRAEIEKLQAEKLARLLRVALDHSPWHADRIRAAGLEARVRDGAVGFDDLRRLPPMTRADAREHAAAIRWLGVPGGAFPYNTGGSSGEPLQFHFGRSRQASDAAGRIRARRWWGVDLGEREAYLWGAPVELQKTDHVKTVRDRLLNQLVLNAFEMSPARMDEYVEALRVFRPRCLYGYASSVALLAAHARERGLRVELPGLRVVCTTGEPLYPHERALIGQVFRAPVANEYGSRDIGFTAHETPAGQMLLMSESIVLEVLDPRGDPVRPGETGEAVLTGLHSEAQPFIRYRTGDLVRRSDERCADGRGLHVLGEVRGRTGDFVVRPDGTVMHALAVIYVLRAVEGVAEFKLVQHAVDELEVFVVRDARWSDSSRQRIVAGLEARMGPGVRAVVREVDAIPPERSGKHRHVVSRVALGAGLAPAASLEEAGGSSSHGSTRSARGS